MERWKVKCKVTPVKLISNNNNRKDIKLRGLYLCVMWLSQFIVCSLLYKSKSRFVSNATTEIHRAQQSEFHFIISLIFLP